MNNRTSLLLFSFIIGLIATLFWWRESPFVGVLKDDPVRSIGTLGVLTVFTSANLIIRWLRWHSLTRYMNAGLTIRDSITVYFITLPAILTPFYIGELTRGLLLSRRYPHIRGVVVWAWLFERLLDAGVLLVMLLYQKGERLPAIGLVVLLAGLGLLICHAVTRLRKRVRGIDGLVFSAWNLGLSTVSWLIPVVGLAVASGMHDAPIGLAFSMDAFAAATLAGGISGIPGGSGITGSMLILDLCRIGIAAPVAATIAFLFRLATVWYAVLLGIGFFWRWRRKMADLFTDSEAARHFDQVADVYADQIGEHIRQKLLVRKTDIIVDVLGEGGIYSRAVGLDLGCGPGWYTCEMHRRGFDMVGVDAASRQIDKAREAATIDGLPCRFEAMSASNLAFESNRFDFVYSINMLHHIADEKERARVFSEIVRVLKPGGCFIMHEMNAKNPLFRIYLSYVFPLMRQIDEGNERWLSPDHLPEVPGAEWSKAISYFTFLPDCISRLAQERLAQWERRLESSGFRRYSAHFAAVLRKAGS